MCSAAKSRRREVGLIGRIRVVLGLEAEPRAPLINLPTLSSQRAIQKVSRVELDARFGRPHLHRSSGPWFPNLGRESEHTHPTVDDKVVIVAIAKFYLLVLSIDSQTYCGAARKVERSAGNGLQLSSRNGP